ncbi:MAG: DUF4118 domain-containing protein [Anaerolineae bacterium]|nr:DUF4118 domain-containing protein [Anaerolineae bacterium]
MTRTNPANNLFRFQIFRPRRLSRYYLDYVISFGIIVLITLLGLLIRKHINPTNLVMPYLLGVVSVAVLYGRGPAMFASVLGVIAFDIFLVPPYLTFAVEDTEYLITFLALFLVGIVISNLTAEVKEQMLEAQWGEARVLSLYNLSQDLAAAYCVEDVTKAITGNIGNALDHDIYLFLNDDGDTSSPELKVITAPGAAPRQVDTAVMFTYLQELASGSGTPHYPQAGVINLPLLTNSGCMGVISLSAKEPDDMLGPEQLQLFEAYANLSALALERLSLNKQAGQTQLLKEKEKFQTALLNCVSHDLRTPLVTITGTLSSLNDEIHLPDIETQRNLVRDALSEAERLNWLVSNLLNMSRLESGALKLQLETVDAQDLIGTTLGQMKDRIDCPVTLNISEELPLISADFVLVEQALINILDNAVKYSPEGSPIEISVRREDEWVYIDVADCGLGIPEDDMPFIFDKFYRVEGHTKLTGTGLGLAIAKGIIDAHGAKLSAMPRPEGGTIFRMGFPHENPSQQDAV